MVVDLGYPQDFGTSWCFRFQSLLRFQVRIDVTVEAKQLQAHGGGSIGMLGGGLLQKLRKTIGKLFESNGLFFNLARFGIWGHPTPIGKLNALKKDRRSLKKQCGHGGKVALARRILIG